MKDTFKYARLFLLVFMLGACLQGFAAQENRICNLCADSDNYYVQPGEIYISLNGMYASIDGTLIQINTLCADEKGVFVPVEEIIAGDLVKCPFCRRWYDPESKVPHNCQGVPD